MNNSRPNKNKQNGFSLVELLIVVLVVSIIAVLALPQIMSSRRLFRFAGVQKQVVNVLREARQHALSQRKPITFRYDNANKRIIFFGGTFGVAGDANNQIIELAGNGVTADELIYGRPTGVSSAALGDGTNLTTLTANVVDIAFQTDGSVVDSSNNPINKALFFYDTNTPNDTAFAVSILGAGGRAKLWRYSSNVNVYVE